MIKRKPTFKRPNCQMFNVGDRVESSIRPDKPSKGKILGWYDVPGDPWHGHYAVLWDGWRGEDNAEPHDDGDIRKV